MQIDRGASVHVQRFRDWIAEQQPAPGVPVNCQRVRLHFDGLRVQRQVSDGVPASERNGWVWEALIQVGQWPAGWVEVPQHQLAITDAIIAAYRGDLCSACVGARMLPFNRHGTLATCDHCKGSGMEPPPCTDCGDPPGAAWSNSCGCAPATDY